MGDKGSSEGPDLFVRGPVPERDDVQALLHARKLQVKGFVIACMRALLADPDRFLDQLKPHWPERRRAGRPPKRPAPVVAADPSVQKPKRRPPLVAPLDEIEDAPGLISEPFQDPA